jgi:hypothetical protein
MGGGACDGSGSDCGGEGSSLSLVETARLGYREGDWRSWVRVWENGGDDGGAEVRRRWRACVKVDSHRGRCVEDFEGG